MCIRDRVGGIVYYYYTVLVQVRYKHFTHPLFIIFVVQDVYKRQLSETGSPQCLPSSLFSCLSGLLLLFVKRVVSCTTLPVMAVPVLPDLSSRYLCKAQKCKNGVDL